MIQITTPVQSVSTLQSEVHPRLAMLHRKYHELSLEVSDEQCPSLPSVATFVPSAGQSIAFDRPIVPVGSVLLCEFSHHSHADGRIANPTGCFEGYRGKYLSHTAETLWEPESWFTFPVSACTYATQHDERLMRSPRLLDTLIGLGLLAQRLSEQEPADHWRLKLPPTLLGVDPKEPDLVKRLLSRPTTSVRTHAQMYGLSIEQAWQELDSATRVEGDIKMTGLRLVDARLCADMKCGTDRLPPVLSAFHDMRPALGRNVTNPAQKLTAEEWSELIDLIDEHHEPGRAAQELRQRMPQTTAEGCTDADLITALRNPDRPLVASRIAKRQAWSMV